MVQILTYGLNKKMSEAEAHLWNSVLKDRLMLGYSFDRRIEVLDHNAAFLSLELRLIVEIDSSSGYQKEERRKTAEREFLFRLGGYTVLRFSESEILTDVEKVRSMIKEWIVLNTN
jgi:very-short-patch-repair endonuclease